MQTSLITGCMFAPMMPQMISTMTSGKMPGVDVEKVIPIMMQDTKHMITDLIDYLDKLNIH